MRRREKEPIEKVSLNLYRDEFGKLQDLYPELGAGKVIRMLVRAHLRKIDLKTLMKSQGEQELVA